ncbi:unnamed protein product, partial [Symbiodinium pilosum]
ECHDCADDIVVSGPLMFEYGETKKCLDYDTEGGHLLVAECHGGHKQAWYFDGAALKSKYDDRCLDYFQTGGNVFMHLDLLCAKFH